MERNFPQYRTYLNSLIAKLRKEIPGTMDGFAQLRSQSMKDGKLTYKMKELIALGISIASRCDGCISYHVKGALKAEATREEILETVGVAIYMGGGPSMIYGAEALAALDQYASV